MKTLITAKRLSLHRSCATLSLLSSLPPPALSLLHTHIRTIRWRNERASLASPWSLWQQGTVSILTCWFWGSHTYIYTQTAACWHTVFHSLSLSHTSSLIGFMKVKASLPLIMSSILTKQRGCTFTPVNPPFHSNKETLSCITILMCARQSPVPRSVSLAPRWSQAPPTRFPLRSEESSGDFVFASNKSSFCSGFWDTRRDAWLQNVWCHLQRRARESKVSRL